jgi:hypothetical protein
MTKHLKEVDPVYESVKSFMSKEEKIKYCESLVRETEDFLNTTVRPIDEKTRARYKELINAAKEEIKLLSHGTN